MIRCYSDTTVLDGRIRTLSKYMACICPALWLLKLENWNAHTYIYVATYPNFVKCLYTHIIHTCPPKRHKYYKPKFNSSYLWEVDTGSFYFLSYLYFQIFYNDHPKTWFLLFSFFYCNKADIQYYIVFRCTTWWVDNCTHY